MEITIPAGQQRRGMLRVDSVDDFEIPGIAMRFARRKALHGLRAEGKACPIPQCGKLLAADGAGAHGLHDVCHTEV